MVSAEMNTHLEHVELTLNNDLSNLTVYRGFPNGRCNNYDLVTVKYACALEYHNEDNL